MGLMNSHQILKGARTTGGIKTYALAGVYERPTASTVTGDTVSFTGGVIEIEGRYYKLSDLPFDFGSVAGNLISGRDYVLAAVPKYLEPVTRTDAETAGVNYVVSTTQNNEYVLNYFLPSNIEQMIFAAGGPTALAKKVFTGVATLSELTVYNDYTDAVSKLSDPRYIGQPLQIKGFEYVIAEVYDQDNNSQRDVTSTMTEAEFRMLQATQGHIPAERKVMLESAAATAYNSKPWKLLKAVRYTTDKTAALLDQNGTPIDLTVANPFNAAGTSYVGVMEYYMASNMIPGHEGAQRGIYRWLTKENNAALGRVNPIYLDNPMMLARTMLGGGPKSQLCLYADPTPLIRVTAAVAGATVTLTNKRDAYDFLFDG